MRPEVKSGRHVLAVLVGATLIFVADQIAPIVVKEVLGAGIAAQWKVAEPQKGLLVVAIWSVLFAAVMSAAQEVSIYARTVGGIIVVGLLVGTIALTSRVMLITNDLYSAAIVFGVLRAIAVTAAGVIVLIAKNGSVTGSAERRQVPQLG